MATVPPSFGDLGKSTKDLFEKEFDFSKVKLCVKTKTDSGVEFETNGSHDTEKSRTTGSFKSKFRFPKQGIVFTETWNTSSELNTELVYDCSYLEGLKVTLSSVFVPSSGSKSAKLKAGYKREYLNVDADVDLQMTGPIFRGSSVFMYNGWYGGFQLGYDTNTAKLVNNNVAVGYQGQDFTVHASVANLADCKSTVYHKVNDDTQVGLSSTYNVQTNNVALGLVGQYEMNDHSLLKAKVNNQGQIGMSYTKSLRSGVKLNLSGLIEGRNINAGGHKLGLSLEFDSSC